MPAASQVSEVFSRQRELIAPGPHQSTAMAYREVIVALSRVAHHVIKSHILGVLQPERCQVLDVALFHQREAADLQRDNKMAVGGYPRRLNSAHDAVSAGPLGLQDRAHKKHNPAGSF